MYQTDTPASKLDNKNNMYQVTMTTPWGTYVLGEYEQKEQAEEASKKLNEKGRHTRVRESKTV